MASAEAAEAAESANGRAAEPGIFVTRSVEEASHVLSEVYYDMRLEVRRADAGDFVTRIHQADLGALTVGDVSFGTGIRTGYCEPGFYHVCVPLHGGFGVQEGAAPPVRTTTSKGVIYDPTRNISVYDWEPDCRVMAVKVCKLAVHRQLEILLGRPLGRQPRFKPYIDITCGTGRSWAGLAQWSLLDWSVPRGLLHQPLVAGRLEQTLLQGLLLATDHSYRAQLEAPPPQMRPAAVKRVMEAVREHPAEPYDAAQLAAVAQVSLRTLQEAFRKHVGMSPMAYVTEVRLQRVRMQLRTSPPDGANVTDVAYQWGFAHLGRFAQRYRARFGETPSQTLRSP
ncbi:AraC family transcriptional regulator [Streptomyces sp. SYP-A7185]|uniref:AraC family transcriptional regulator n=1 Tax=Streptomyces sp. SYP-A7185 TaxID=3040076 RepID=UPI0038F7152B